MTPCSLHRRPHRRWVHHGATQLLDSSWCRILRSRPSQQAKRSNSTTAAVSFRLRLHDFSIYEVGGPYCTVRLIHRHSVSSLIIVRLYKPVCSHGHSHLPDISDAWVCGHLAVRQNIIRRRQRATFVKFPSRRDAAEPLC